MNYVDRFDFVAGLSKHLQAISSPSIVLIAAASGVGKYSAVRKFFEDDIGKKYNRVTVPALMVNSETYKIKYEYFFMLLERIQNDYKYFNLKESNLSFTRFAKHNGIYKEILAERISSSIEQDTFSKKGIVTLFARMGLNRLYNVGAYNCVEALNRRDANSVTIGKKYINHILCNDQLILELCSVQYMDLESVFAICNTLKSESGKGVILLEYDIDYSNYSNYSNYEKFCDILKSCCDEDKIEIISLTPLEFEDFYTVLNSKREWDLTLYKTWLQKEYYQSKTKSITDFLDKISVKWNSGDFGAEFSKILTLSDFFECASKTELYILCTIDIHGGSINTQILQECIQTQNNMLFYKEKEVEACINNMIQHYILDRDNERVFFLNGKVHEAWKKHVSSLATFSESILLAADNCFNLYKQKLSEQENKSNSSEVRRIIHILLGIVTCYLPKRIVYMSNYITLVTNEFTTPEDARYPIILLVEELRKNKKAYIEVYYEIIELCCDMELYEEALQFWNDIQELVLYPEVHECNKANYLYCKVHYLCDKHDDVIWYIKNQLKYDISPESMLYYSIYLIITYRACNKYSEINSVIMPIINNKNKYIYCAQYGLFLRISEVYKTRLDAIPDVAESTTFFMERNIEVQAAKSMVSLTFLYAITNNLEKAHDSLQYAKKILKHKYQHILCNNEAAINILKNCFDEKTEKLLNQAVISSNSVFSNLAIYNNQMIYYYETKQLNELQSRVQMIERQLDKLIDKHLMAVLCYNLFVFLKEINPSKSQEYFSIAYRYRKHCSTLNKRLTNEQPKDEHEKWFLQKPWHITMLSFWETDFL